MSDKGKSEITIKARIDQYERDFKMSTSQVMEMTKILTSHPEVLTIGEYTLQTQMSKDGFDLLRDMMSGKDVMIRPNIYNEIKSVAKELGCAQLEKLTIDFENASTSNIDVSMVLSRIDELKEEIADIEEGHNQMSEDLGETQAQINELRVTVTTKIDRMEQEMAREKKMYQDKLNEYKKEVDQMREKLKTAVTKEQFREVMKQVDDAIKFITDLKMNQAKRDEWENSCKEDKVQKLLAEDPTGEKLLAFIIPIADFGDAWSQGRLGNVYYERSDYETAHKRYLNATKGGNTRFSRPYVDKLLADRTEQNMAWAHEILDAAIEYQEDWAKEIKAQLPEITPQTDAEN